MNRIVLGGVLALLAVASVRLGSQTAATDSSHVPLGFVITSRRDFVRSPLKWSAAQVPVREGDDVRSLLRAQGVLPNADALAAFYRLNPRVADIDTIKIGTLVNVPKVLRRHDQLTSHLGAPFIVLADTAYRPILARHAAEIDRASRLLPQSGDSRARTLARASTSITTSAKQIADAPIPLDPQSQERVTSDLGQYSAALRQVAAGTVREDSALTIAGHVKADLAVHAAAAVAATNSRASIRFDVIGTGGVPRSGLVVVCDYPVPTSFSRKMYFEKSGEAFVLAQLSLGRWIVWVEDLSGHEVSLSRRPFRIDASNDAYAETLVVH